MCAQHDNFVGFIRSWNFSDDIERVQIVIMELVFDIHFEPDGDVFLEQPPDAAVMFDGHDDLRRNGGIRHIAAATGLYKNRTTASLAGFYGGDNAFLQKKFQPPRVEFLRIPASCGRSATLSRRTAARWLDGLIHQVGKVVVRKSSSRRLELGGDFTHCCRQDIFSAELA